MTKSIFDFTVRDIRGQEKNLADYKGQLALVVNVASKCGLTPQYEGLQALYDRYRDKGFVILGFPANDFLAQEPGTDTEIESFCTTRYQVNFPMFSKISVKGPEIHPLYRYLTTESEKPGEIAWNFHKFLIGRDGRVLSNIDPRTKPEDLAEIIEKHL
jgi:glutathione peroxidase